MTSFNSSHTRLRSPSVSTMIQEIGLSSSVLTARIRDSPTSGGNSVTRSSFSDTPKRATSLLVPQSNLRTTVDFPSMEVDETCLRRSTALSFSSSRSVTSRSTSRGAAPR